MNSYTTSIGSKRRLSSINGRRPNDPELIDQESDSDTDSEGSHGLFDHESKAYQTPASAVSISGSNYFVDRPKPEESERPTTAAISTHDVKSLPTYGTTNNDQQNQGTSHAILAHGIDCATS
jgi:hypothetical protein